MKKLLAVLLFVFALPANALLLCNMEGGGQVRWLVGEKVFLAGQVPLFCLADGAELTYIEWHFSGLRERYGPSTRGNRQVLWVGEDAQFIVNNL